MPVHFIHQVLGVEADILRIHPQVEAYAEESPDSIGQRVSAPNFICFIDDLDSIPGGAVAGFFVVTEGNPKSPVEEAQGPHVIVIWWLPRAEWAENNMEQLLPVFATACREVLRRYPGSEGWPIYGDYPGVGETPDERLKSSLGMVTDWQKFWNHPESPVGPFAELGLNPYNEWQCRIIGTVGQVVRFADWFKSCG